MGFGQAGEYDFPLRIVRPDSDAADMLPTSIDPSRGSLDTTVYPLRFGTRDSGASHCELRLDRFAARYPSRRVEEQAADRYGLPWLTAELTRTHNPRAGVGAQLSVDTPEIREDSN